MYNRCMFLAHIRSHGQTFKNLDMTCLSLEPLPKDLIKFGLDNEHNTLSPTIASVTISKPVSGSPSTVTTTTSSIHSSISTFTSTFTSDCVKESSTVIDSARKLVSKVVVNATDVPEKKINKPLRKALGTVQKLIPSALQNTPKVGHTNDAVNNYRNSKDANVVTVDTIETVGCASDKDTGVVVLQDDMEITISNASSSDAAEKQYSALVEATEKQSKAQNESKQVKGRRRCPECDIHITAKVSLRKHLQNYSQPLSEDLKCNICQLILQSPCALKMHLRIHMKAKPFRCPECAIEFHIYDRFIMHLKYTCCHMTKIVRYTCSVCKSVLSSLASLEEHLMTQHVRSIFKCGGCPIAFINVRSVERHKQRAHPGRIVPTQSYQQCKLCPERLIPKKKFVLHMKNHLNEDKVRVYAYQCPTCKCTFFQRTELIYHRMKCDTRDGIIRSVLEDVPHELDAQNVAEDEQEMELPTKKRKISNRNETTQEGNEDEEEEEEEEVGEEEDPLNLEGFQVVEEILQEPRVETCVVCKTETVLILPGRNQSSQSMCCKKCVSPCGGQPRKSDPLQRNKLLQAKLKGYKCKICNSTNYMDLKSIFEHFKKLHRQFEGQSINEWLIIDNNISNVKKSSTVTTAETIKEKYKKKRILNSTPPVVHVKEEFDADSQKESSQPEKKRPKRCVKSKQKIVVDVKSFESGQLIVAENSDQSQFSCSKCEFVGTNKEELRDHVGCHRTDPTAIQCLECGECFVVLPSLEKHLIINHRITNIDKYLADNRQCVPSSLKSEDGTTAESDKAVESSNTCRVCHEVFESKTVLDKHFRSHGMAFLLKNMSQ